MKLLFSILLGILSFNIMTKALIIDNSIAEIAGWLIGIGMLLVFNFFENRKESKSKIGKVLIKELNEEILILKEENKKLKELSKKDIYPKEKEFNFYKE